MAQGVEGLQDQRYSNPIWTEENKGSGEAVFDNDSRPTKAPPPAQRHGADEPLSPRNSDMAEEMAAKSVCAKFAAFIGPGNVSAGAASALHVNIYLFALGMMLASPYYVRSIGLYLRLDVMSTTMVAVTGSALMQTVHTLFGSYNHYVISNADTMPGAVMIEVLTAVREECEMRWELENKDLFEEIDLNGDLYLTDAEIEAGRAAGFAWTRCYEDRECWQGVHSTMVAAMMFTGLVTSAILYVMGRYKLGNLISFVPLTVEAAFLAGCGWKIAKTGVLFMVDKEKLLSGDLSPLLNSLPMIGMGVFVLWAEARFHHSKHGEWTLPLLLLFLIVLFYGFFVIVVVTSEKSFVDMLTDARQPDINGTWPVLPKGNGWLMDANPNWNFYYAPQFAPVWHFGDSPEGETVFFNPMTITPGAIFTIKQLVTITILNVITVLSILLNSSAIEEETGEDIDFDQELKVSGWGNAASALQGGPLGFSSVGKTMLCHGMGGHYYAGVFAVAYYVFYWLIGFFLARFVPVSVLGAFIFAIGVELLMEWLIKIKERITPAEYYEVCFLFLLMTFNFVLGFFIGMFMSLIVFAGQYANVPCIKTVMDATEYQGRAIRGRYDSVILDRWGMSILTIRLQGFIFFFTAEKLRIDIQSIMDKRTGDKKVQHLVLDFRFVQNFDTTAIKKFRKLLRYAADQKVTVCVTNLKAELRQRMEEEGIYDSLHTPPGGEHGHGHGGHGHGGHGHGDHGHGDHAHASKASDIAGRGAGALPDAHEALAGPHAFAPDEDFVALRYFGDSDDAVEHCANELLRGVKTARRLNFMKPDPAVGRFTVKSIFKGVAKYFRMGLGSLVQGQLFDSQSFRELGTTEIWNKGQVLQHQGDWSNRKLWFISRGSVTMYHTDEDGFRCKVESRHNQTIVGELGFFLDEPRYADLEVTADDTETVAFTLDNYRTLETEYPHLAKHLHTYIIEMLSGAIKRQTHEINLLLATYENAKVDSVSVDSAIDRIEKKDAGHEKE